MYIYDIPANCNVPCKPINGILNFQGFFVVLNS